MIDKSTKIKVGHKGDCTVLKPSLMCAVPLVIDRIYKGIHEQIHAKGLFFEKLMTFFYRYKSYYRQVSKWDSMYYIFLCHWCPGNC